MSGPMSAPTPAPGSPPPAALPKRGPTSRTFFSQRLRLHYVDWGNEAAPPLLLVHGGQDHCRNWDWVAEDLRRDYHVIAPDLRGHGDSAWAADGNYTMAGYVADLAQLIHQQRLAPVTIIAHSLGGNIALRYTGIYPDRVRKLVAIEGLGPSPRSQAKREAMPIDARMRDWIETRRALSARIPRRYPSIEEALARMQEQNKHLSPAQARHLTEQGVNQNEDGTYNPDDLGIDSEGEFEEGKSLRLKTTLSCSGEQLSTSSLPAVGSGVGSSADPHINTVETTDKNEGISDFSVEGEYHAAGAGAWA
jgi:pimeloyl-ACP methyl ester carboxylesterase